ncbi:MAG TPA: 3-hydroxyacyl-CoA dehydrogenase NAD-binding domain-containing protein [Ferruginibacter sp.]|jgi:3-hydroxybutyryl-CoA dehydrogenase|nr:3-hydroxyacyl-CoA dehydrogenase NAD-binding domain-containing protein [Ferruginibacter sp.]
MAQKNIAVIGAGTMGNGIAHVFAQNDYKVTLIDINAPQLEKAVLAITKNLDRQVAKEIITETQKQSTLNNIVFVNDIAAGVKNAYLVVEAATEDVALKLKIFKQIGEAAPAGCILATNTSSISITKIAAVTKRPESVIGMHFMNPVPVMKLVEVINGHATKKEVTDTIVELSKQLGKIPCVVNDYPGFIANRILMPMINEAILALEEGVAGVAEIDTIMKLGMSHPMGPLQLADFIGLDVCLNIMFVLHDGFDNIKYTPAALLINMVAAKTLGVKTGEGFYTYSKDNKDLVVSSRFK